MNHPGVIVDITRAKLQKLNHASFQKKEIIVDVLRLDSIDPVISGNKWFKLKYHLHKALDEKKAGIITFGGSHSNHLLATAYACKKLSIKSIGIIRGEKPEKYSFTLRDAEQLGMELQFISRKKYKEKQSLIEPFSKSHPEFLVIPDGAQSDLGIRGAMEILSILPENDYSHIACSVGTGTTMTGIINASKSFQKIMGISSLKISDKNKNSLSLQVSSFTAKRNWELLYDYHFGGYAKKNDTLLHFMNTLYTECGIPTDFVYTGKLFYAVFDCIEKDYFLAGDKILIVHSGGLQGNKSLDAGTLCF